MRLRDITPTHHRLLRDLTNGISSSLETEFVNPSAEDGPSVGIMLREKRRQTMIEIPATLLIEAAEDLVAREAIRVHIKGRRDRMLFKAPPSPLPKHITSAPPPGGMHFGPGRGGGGFRGRR